MKYNIHEELEPINKLVIFTETADLTDSCHLMKTKISVTKNSLVVKLKLHVSFNTLNKIPLMQKCQDTIQSLM